MINERGKSVKILELFSGAGGFTANINKNIFKIVGAVDIDVRAQEVYLKNNPSVRFIHDDVIRIPHFRDIFRNVDIIIAGPDLPMAKPIITNMPAPIIAPKFMITASLSPRTLFKVYSKDMHL